MSSRGRLGRIEPEARGRTPGKMPGQLGNVLAPLAERRNDDGKYGQAIPEVLAELARGNHGRQVAVGGGHDPHVDADRPLAADAVEPAVLQDPQQADLGGQRQLGQFVQQQGAAVGPFEPALPSLDRAGERALLVPEELRVDQFMRDRAAVHADERPLRTRRAVVDRPGNHLLARARLAENEHRHVGLRDQLDAFHDGTQPGADADDRIAELFASQAFEQGAFVGFGRFPQGSHFGHVAIVLQGCGEWLQEHLRQRHVLRFEDGPRPRHQQQHAEAIVGKGQRAGQHVGPHRPGKNR